MSSTFHLVSHPDYNCLLRVAGNRAARMERVAYLRKHAILILEKAIARIPVEKPSIVKLYKAKGIDLVWQLEDDSDAGRFYFTLRDYNPTPAETDAAELLMACVAAQKAGDVIEFAEREMGQKSSEAQSQRRIGKTKLNDSQKRAISREYEVAFTKYGMTQSLANKYEVSEDTISRLVKKTKQD